MKNLYFIITLLLLVTSCSNIEKNWTHIETIDLGNCTPIGIIVKKDSIWIADGDHNQIVVFNKKGKELKTYADFDRPMHLAHHKTHIYIPEYGADQITQFKNGERTVLKIPDSLDAPAGVDIYKNEIAVADFYNHRILFYNGNNWKSIGIEGKNKGELYYPTDVQILSDKLIVADAYNNRVQVFNKEGHSLQLIGESEKMNAATGVFATEKEILVTDFENNRVLNFNHGGELKQVISKSINKPTDILIANDVLYIANYKGKNLLKYKRIDEK